MMRRRLGVLVGVSWLACGAGCEAQVGEDYTGEPLLSLRGKVLLSEDLAQRFSDLAGRAADIRGYL